MINNNPNSPTQGYPNSNYPPPPYGPGGPQRNPWIWIVGAIAIVLIIGVIAIFALSGTFAASPSTASAQATATASASASTATATVPTPGVTPTPSPNGSSTGGATGGSSGGSTGGATGGASVTLAQATGAVSAYYADINAKNYQGAYNIWGSQYRNATSYATFAQGFANTQRDVLQLGSATRLADGSIKVPVTVIATVGSGVSTVVNTYQGYYIAGLEGSQPHFLSANLQLTNSNKDSVKRAVSLIEQYYDDINARDYTDAYSIWGSAYHKSTSYSQFSSGFASTKSVSIIINYDGSTLLNDGTVRVPLTINAVNTSGSGTVSHTYHGYYIVGMESQVWHLLTANIQ